jgi:predicted dehydrogenase
VENVKVIVVGCGNMGRSHARAYKALPGFDLVAVCDHTARNSQALAQELGGIADFTDLQTAVEESRPDAVAICTRVDTHASYALEALRCGLHVFVEKPIAENVEDAARVIGTARESGKKLVVGYILRHHPSWMKFVELARELGKPLVMRMNLNQQSAAEQWQVHKKIMQRMSPIVDCGVHYVDVMCQMTRSRPVRVQAVGTRISDEIAPDMYNYGQLQVTFEDKSVGWYEAGWGPMMSETAFFVKDVSGPEGSVSMVTREGAERKGSADLEGHTQTNCLLRHHAALNDEGLFARGDTLLDMSDEPDHQELCNREQAYFLRAIREDVKLDEHLTEAVESLRIVLAADQSIREGRTIEL